MLCNILATKAKVTDECSFYDKMGNNNTADINSVNFVPHQPTLDKPKKSDDLVLKQFATFKLI